MHRSYRSGLGPFVLFQAFVALIGVGLVGAFWGTVGYVIWHFISKFW